MIKFAFCFRTPFTKEKVIIESDNIENATSLFNTTVRDKRKPINVYVDYIWLLNGDGEYIERIK